MSADTILVTREGPLGWIRINRPERLNAFSPDMRGLLEAALRELDADDDVRVVLITGAGRAFCTGGDVEVMAQLAAGHDVEGFRALVEAGERIVTLIDEMDKPVIAVVNGPAAGAGACLALACDLRIASETATIGFTFVRVGQHPDWGGTWWLPRMVGPALAAEMIFTGGMIAAERAERLGLVNRVVAPTRLEAAARAFAGEIAHAPRTVIRHAKRAIRSAMSGSTLSEQLLLEREAQLDAFESDDFQEGVRAFIEKRAPRFGRTPAPLDRP
ncbi:MAG TPA: enoyl-CoA hydratase-related protein [Longimicrobiales bacterium]